MSWSQHQQNNGQYNNQQYNQYNNQYQQYPSTTSLTNNQYQQYNNNSTRSLINTNNNPSQHPYGSAQSAQSTHQQATGYNPYSMQKQQQYTNTNTHNPYTTNQYANYANQQRQQYNNRLANAYQSSQPPVPSPFLQAQQQEAPPPPPTQESNSTPPNPDDQNNVNNNMNNTPHNAYSMNGMQNNNNNMQNMITVQQRMKQMICEQQKTINEFVKNEENLRKQLKERDDHWRQTLSNSLNKKDLRINELFQETLELQQENKDEQMKVVDLRQTIMQLKAESSKLLFTQRKLPGIGIPGLPGVPGVQSCINLNKKHRSVSIPESEDTDIKENNIIAKVDNDEHKSNSDNMKKKGNKKQNTDGIVADNKSKDEKKNALAEMFGARNGNKKEEKDDKKEAIGNVKLEKYNKMKKVGLPMKSIINKMRMDGCKQDLIDEFEGKKKKSRNGEDNPALAKYNKMKKIGMPMVSIINKMRMDGCSGELIAEFNGESSDEKSNIDLSDVKFDKYKKMKKLNMPVNSIINKMRMDGLSKDEIDAFTGNKAKKKKKDKKSAMQELAIAMGLKPKPSVGPQRVKKLKRVHWKVIELKDIKGTFWEDINKKYDDDNNMKLGAKFELDFQIRTRKPRLIAKKKSHFNLDLNKLHKKEKKERIVWIQGKRDQNIQIGLKTMGINNEEIYNSIAEMNDSIMNLNRLETIYELVPSVDEQRKAEEKIEQLGDDVEFCGPSEQFHIELSPLPEVKQQLSKWLFAKTFKELYMDRLQQVNNIIKACYAIKQSKAFKCYLRIMLQIGNLMNHGIVEKSMVYGFNLESLSLLEGIKNFSGSKTLAMFLFEYAYNNFYNDIAGFDDELNVMKAAVRIETAVIETNIRAMADEFLNIDLFCRRIHDEYHPEDTIKFRDYMTHFGSLQTTNMMNLKVKIQNAQSIAKNVASYYGIQLDEGKPESLFRKVQLFVDIMDKAKRTLIKLEKERQKIASKKAKEKEKQKKLKEKQGNKDNKKGGKKMKFNISQLLSRKKEKKQKEIEEEEKGNILFHDIKTAANKFAQRQKKMEKRLSTNFAEKTALSKGQLSPTMVNDKIKSRLSTAFIGNDNQQTLSPTEIEKLRNNQYDAELDDEMNDDEYNRRMKKVGHGNHSPQKSNNLMVPGME